MIEGNDSDVVIGVDTGGTFTDVTLSRSNRIWTVKVASTPDDPSRAFAEGVSRILQLSETPSESVTRILHGTTVATNLILEGKGSRVAMLVTKGFRYVVEIGRQDVPRGFSLHSWVKPPRPVKPQHIWEVAGRIGSGGQELVSLDEESIRSAAREIAASGIRSVAIVFINSFANRQHEARAEQIVKEVYPEALVSTSSSVLPVFREYERSMTTILNAYVMEHVSSYVAQLESRLAGIGVRAPLFLMKSSGGVTGTKNVKERPVETALSGPAAGVVGEGFVGAMVDTLNLIGIDIGGTSADISVVHDGQMSLTNHGQIGNWPIGLTMVDVVTIGAGGGSIARVTESGALLVGPESAGASPGPVCYRRGGSEPTVTDAHLVLGHIPPYLLNGEFELDKEAAHRAIQKLVAEPLGISTEVAARGILKIADNNMVGAIRVVTVERGLDPRDFTLLPFGGAGTLHSGSLAREMKIRTTLIPPSPGVLSAVGLLVSNLRSEFTRSYLYRSGDPNVEALGRVFKELNSEATTWLEREGVPMDARSIRSFASMRYENQGFELSVPWIQSSSLEVDVAAVIDAFHSMHERVYSFAQRDARVEITTLRSDAEGMFHAPRMRVIGPGDGKTDPVVGHVDMLLESGSVRAPIVARERLRCGDEVSGPSIVQQLDTTILLLEGQRAVVHESMSLIVTDTTV